VQNQLHPQRGQSPAFAGVNIRSIGQIQSLGESAKPAGFCWPDESAAPPNGEPHPAG